jgi:hypothetical protein
MDLKKKLIIAVVTMNVVCLWATVFHFTRDRTPPAPVYVARPSVVTPVVPPVVSVADAKASITEEECRTILTWLASDAREGRMSGKTGNKDAALYIQREFESYGLKTSTQQFRISRMNPGPKNETGDDFTNNVIGILPGETDRQIVVGAHFDHVGYGPRMSTDGITGIHNGADDNGSGTTALLEVAEAFGKLGRQKHTLVFIGFSGEEMGLIGSRAYVAALNRDQISKIDLMVNFDMVGYLKDQKTLPALGARRVTGLVDIIARIDDTYPFKVIPAGEAPGNSDHASFGNEGVPYVFFFTGLHANYHKVTDDADKIDYVGLKGIAQFGFEMIAEFDKTGPSSRIKEKAMLIEACKAEGFQQ